MAVGVRMKFPGATPDQYDRACSAMGLTPREAGPPGCLFHWASVQGDGMLLTDVWNTRERYEEFARDEIGPKSAQVGITEPPESTFYDVYNYLTAGPLSEVSAPIAVVMEFEGEMRQYDEVLELMGLTPEGAGVKGGLFHRVTEIEGGARTTDVWQDRAAFDEFLQMTLIPYTAKVGVGAAKSVNMYDVYNYFTAGP